ncbi:grainyhead-like, partial [Entomortierella beljakovae]
QQQQQQQQTKLTVYPAENDELESNATPESGTSTPKSDGNQNLRFRISLEAQTAAMQRQDETPVTYLNKGQFYTIGLQDTDEFDGELTSVIRVAFHDASHRRLAARYWSFWLSQQQNPKSARALDIEKASSSGILEVQSKTFDRISFKWNGKAGAKLMTRFNCLSTDFSRIKGVKGIPLRVHIDTFPQNSGKNNNSLGDTLAMERSFAKIKLFRDKGAERKNKDDHKHLEKMWDKMRGKNADTNPLVSMLAPVRHVSFFSECMDLPEDDGENETLDLNDTLGQDDGIDEEDGDSGNNGGSSSRSQPENLDSSSAAVREDRSSSNSNSAGGSTGGDSALVKSDRKRRRLAESEPSGKISNSSNNNNNSNNSNNNNSNNNNSSSSSNTHEESGNNSGGREILDTSQSQVGFVTSNSHESSADRELQIQKSNSLVVPAVQYLDHDPSYISQSRKKRPVLCLYIKIGGESVYRAVYLEKYTLADLINKLSEKLEIQATTISCVYRKTVKKELLVRVDDSMVAQMTDELDMVV